MPITRSAKKALRGSQRKKAVNDRTKKEVKDAMKKVEKLVKAGQKGDAKKLLSKTYSVIDKARKKGVMNANTASRRKAKVSKMTK
jgi:small subunit ribosomal protein S20